MSLVRVVLRPVLPGGLGKFSCPKAALFEIEFIEQIGRPLLTGTRAYHIASKVEACNVEGHQLEFDGYRSHTRRASIGLPRASA